MVAFDTASIVRRLQRRLPRRKLKHKREHKRMRERTRKGRRMPRSQAQPLRYTNFRPPVTVPRRPTRSRAAGWCAARFMHSEGGRSDPAPRGGPLPTSHRPRSAVFEPQRLHQLRGKVGAGLHPRDRDADSGGRGAALRHPDHGHTRIQTWPSNSGLEQ